MLDVLGTIWNVFLFIFKWVVIAVLTVLRYALEIIRLIIILMGIVLRIFLAVLRLGTF